MVDQWFCGAVHGNIDGEAERDRMSTALIDAADQISNYDGNVSASGYTPNLHERSISPDDSPANGASETEYLKSFGEELIEKAEWDEIQVADGDI